MKGLLKCLGMLVKKKKKERKVILVTLWNKRNRTFISKKYLSSVEQQCLLALIEIVWSFKTQACEMRLPVT